MVTVIMTEGKREEVDVAYIMQFTTEAEAQAFCDEKNTGHQKYWVKAEIVKIGEPIYLSQPEEE